MRKWLSFVSGIVCVCLILPICAVAQTVDYSQLVDKYYPQELIDDQLKSAPNQEPYKISTYILADLTGSGTKEIVAAYGDGISAIIRVISQSGQLLDEVSKPPMMTLDVALKSFDLNDDGEQEIMLVGSANQGPSKDWLFTWRDGGLVLISPLDSEQPPDTGLFGASVFDIDGDGRSDLLAVLRDQPGSHPFAVYKMIGDDLKRTGTISAVQFFFRHSSQPISENAQFDVDDDSVQYNIRLLNGDDSGKASQVTAATVSLNGRPLFTPQDFNKHVRLLTKSAYLSKHNTLTVRLEGQPGSGITVYAMPVNQ